MALLLREEKEIYLWRYREGKRIIVTDKQLGHPTTNRGLIGHPTANRGLIGHPITIRKRIHDSEQTNKENSNFLLIIPLKSEYMGALYSQAK